MYLFIWLLALFVLLEVVIKHFVTLLERCFIYLSILLSLPFPWREGLCKALFHFILKSVIRMKLLLVLLLHLFRKRTNYHQPYPHKNRKTRVKGQLSTFLFSRIKAIIHFTAGKGKQKTLFGSWPIVLHWRFNLINCLQMLNWSSALIRGSCAESQWSDRSCTPSSSHDRWPEFWTSVATMNRSGWSVSGHWQRGSRMGGVDGVGGAGKGWEAGVRVAETRRGREGEVRAASLADQRK